MKKIIECVIVMALAFFLNACQKTYKTVYDFEVPKTESAKQCVAKCRATREHCLSLCKADDSNCEVRAKARAKTNYAHYIKQQNVEGKRVINDLDSFYNPLQCEQFMCHCEEDFRACYHLCGGQVLKRRVCVKNCK